jgi:hypothetical protein
MPSWRLSTARRRSLPFADRFACLDKRPHAVLRSAQLRVQLDFFVDALKARLSVQAGAAQAMTAP